MPYLHIFYMLLFLGVYLKGFVLSCFPFNWLHRKIHPALWVQHFLHCLPCIPLCTHSMATTTSASCMVKPLQIQQAPPCRACPYIQHLARDGEWKGLWPHVTLKFSFLLVSSLQILQWAPALPTTHVLDRMGALGTLHSPVWGWHSSSPQDLWEWAWLCRLQCGE